MYKWTKMIPCNTASITVKAKPARKTFLANRLQHLKAKLRLSAETNANALLFAF
jgi:hypothetical protein